MSLRLMRPLLCLLFLAFPIPGRGKEPLAGTQSLALEGDLSKRMRDGFERYLRRELNASIERRGKYWRRDFSDRKSYEDSVAPNRRRLRRMIGAVDKRLPCRALELVADTRRASLLERNASFAAHRVRWPVFLNVYGEGVLLEPSDEPIAAVIVLPDADQTPEQLCGLADGLPPAQQLARRLAEHGCRVVVMSLVDRSDEASGNPSVVMTNQPHREWIHRQAFEMGRHLIGYEVQKVRAVVDWFKVDERSAKLPIAVAGYAEGGLIALHAAAVELRIDAALVSGYFQSRQDVFEEPFYRNLFGLLREFGDAEIASLITPRALVIETSQPPDINGPPIARNGRRAVAAPGKIGAIDPASARREVARLKAFHPVDARIMPRVKVTGDGKTKGGFSPTAAAALLAACGLPGDSPDAVRKKVPRLANEAFIAARRLRQVRQLVAHNQTLLRHSVRRRAEFWSKATPEGDAEAWTEKTRFYRDYLWDELIGRVPLASLPARPRTRLLERTEHWTSYEVVLDVHPDVICWGWLLVPRNLKQGERRPVVVCQHGLEGQPRSVVVDDDSRDTQIYKAFAAKLAERGFVTYAPHNFYRGGNEFRRLQRMAHPLKFTLFGITAAQHARHLEWLASLPFVDAERIGFYGLSYGGNTAMRIPALLPQYKAVICSGDFNEWIYKNATIDHRHSMIYHNVWEVFEWNLGHTFNHSDLAALIAPRPFMVERGHDDGVAIDEWVASEYSRVRRLYVKLGVGERTEIEFFNGPHAIHGQGTYRFLHKHLKWPEPAKKSQR